MDGALHWFKFYHIIIYLSSVYLGQIVFWTDYKCKLVFEPLNQGGNLYGIELRIEFTALSTKWCCFVMHDSCFCICMHDVSVSYFKLPYACHHNPLLIRFIRNSSWTLTIHKDRIFSKKLLENKEMDFKNQAMNIQAAGYSSACTVWLCMMMYLDPALKNSIIGRPHFMYRRVSAIRPFFQRSLPKITSPTIKGWAMNQLFEIKSMNFCQVIS